MEINVQESVEVVHLIHEQLFVEIGKDTADVWSSNIWCIQGCSWWFEAFGASQVVPVNHFLTLLW